MATDTQTTLSTLAEQVGAHLSATTIFGAPVERGGITVIPVGTVRFGFGGGGGSDGSGSGEGEGGGAMGIAAPAGYIELKDGRSRFVPVVHPARMLALVCATVLGGMLVGRRGRAASRHSQGRAKKNQRRPVRTSSRSALRL